MKKRLYLALLLTIIPFSLLSGHGRSPEMEKKLNEPVPEWLTIGKTIVLMPTSPSQDENVDFRPRSGGATNSRNRVSIPGQANEMEMDYSIDWLGGNKDGYGVSLSGDGNKLLVNSGTNPHLYVRSPDGKFEEIPIQTPFLTYDESPRWYLRGWSWTNDEILSARAEIADYEGHNVLENRLYLYDREKKILSRLDVSALNLPKDTSLLVTAVGDDLEHLKISAGGKEYVMKGDLRPVRKADPREDKRVTEGGSLSPVSAEETKEKEDSNLEQDKESWWGAWVVIALAILLGMGFCIGYKRRLTRKAE